MIDCGNLGGLIHRGKPASLINTQKASFASSFLSLQCLMSSSTEDRHYKAVSTGLQGISISMCMSVSLSPNHLSGQIDLEVPYSDLAPSVQLLSFPWILQTLVNICVCMCLIKTSKLFRFQAYLVL